MGLVNASVPARAAARRSVEALARELLEKNPAVLRAAKLGFKHALGMTWEQAEDYFYAKLDQSQSRTPSAAARRASAQFLDEKSIRPGLETYGR